jgi:signal peptidase I
MDMDNTQKKSKVTMVRRALGLVVAVPVVGLFLALQTGYIKTYKVISASMEPALMIGDSLLTQPFKPEMDLSGRIVIFPDPTRPNEMLIKRVVAIGGDVVELRRGRIIVNGNPLNNSAERVRGSAHKWNLQDTEVFVLGDNTTDSYDSLDFGPITKSQIQALAGYRYWPWERRGAIR